MLTSKDYEIIEAYLLGSLPEEQKKLFQARQQEPEFQEALERKADILAAIRAEGRESLRLELKALEASRNAPPESSSKVRPLWVRMRWIGVAAAVVVLAGLVFLWVKPTPEDFFAEYFAPYPNDLYAPQRSEGTPPTPQEEAFYYYDTGDYPKAITLMSRLYREDPSATELLFFRGNAYLASGKWHLAVKDFQMLQATPGALFQAESYWYEALAYLQGGEYKSSLSVLSQIASESRNPFHDQAAGLLDALGK